MLCATCTCREQEGKEKLRLDVDCGCSFAVYEKIAIGQKANTLSLAVKDFV